MHSTIADRCQVARANTPHSFMANPPNKPSPPVFAASGLKAIHIATRCATREEFIEQYCAFAGDDSILTPWVSGLMKGTQSRLVIALKDDTPILRGRAQVIELLERPNGKVVRLRLLELDDASRALHGKLLRQRQRTEQLAAAAILSRGLPPPIPGGNRPPPAPPGVAAGSGADVDPDKLAALIESARFEDNQNTPPVLTVPPASGMTPPTPSAPATPMSSLSDTDDTAVGQFDDGTPIRSRDAPVTLPMARSLGMPPTPLLPARPRDATPGSLSATPSSSQERPTGTTRLTAKTRVARQQSFPLSLGAWPARLGNAWSGALARVPENHRPLVAKVAPVAMIGLAFFVMGRCSVGGQDPARDANLARTPGATRGPEPAFDSAFPPVTAVTKEAVAEGPAAGSMPATRPRGPTCHASIATDPHGAAVFWGEVALGETPLENVTVPCGRNLIAIRHPRFDQKVMTVNATMDRPLALSEKLKRPEAAVLLTSAPAGATITIGERKIGTTPGRLDVERYEKIEVTVEKPGFERWTQAVFVDRAEETIHVRLRPERARKR